MSRLGICFLFACTFPVFGKITFEPNKGQTDPQVRYLARTATGVIFATAHEIILHREKAHREPVRFSFENANPHAPWQPLNPTGHKIRYFVGRDTTRHLSGLDTYEKLTRRGIYPGIDLVLYGSDHNQLEYDLIVAPGADPACIRIKAPRAKIDLKTGDLVITQTTRQHKPVIFQGNRTIDGRFRQTGKDTFGFEVAAYDRSKPLTIDPVVESREYIGGIGDDSVTSIGANGFAELTGTTNSIDFPGANASSKHGKDVFYRIGTSTTIIGGSGDDIAAPRKSNRGQGISSIAGTTSSKDLPTYNQPFPASIQADFAGGATDGFLVWSIYSGGTPNMTYIGTDGDDQIHSFFDTGGTRFAIGGSTRGVVLPRPPTIAHSGGVDAFVLVGSWNIGFGGVPSLIRSTFLGGSGDDLPTDVVLSANGELIVAGETSSPNFPLVNAIQEQRQGATDGFIARYNVDTFALISSTLWGGSSADRITALSVTTTQITALGITSSSDFPIRQPIQNANAGGSYDAFITSFDPPLTQYLRSTYFGGSGDDLPSAAWTDSAGTIFFAGTTSSRNFPSLEAYQPAFGGGATDGFVAQLASNGSLNYSSYFGGSGNDQILALALIESNGKLIVGGSTTSPDLPGGAPYLLLDSNHFAQNDAFIATIRPYSGAIPPKLIGAKYLSLDVPIGSAGPIAVSSSDPSRVLISLSRDGEGVAAETSLKAVDSIRIDCLADTGTATISISSSLQADQTSEVRCVQPEIDATPTPSTYLDLWSVENSPAPSLTPQFSMSFIATDPATSKRSTLRLRRAPPAGFNIANSRPDVVQLRDSTGILSATATTQASYLDIQPLSVGETTIAVSSPGFKGSSTLVRIYPPLAGTKNLALAPGYYYAEAIGPIAPGKSVTFQSLNPDLVVLSAAAVPTGSASVTFTSGLSFHSLNVTALPGAAIGTEAKIQITVAGTTSIFRTIRITAPVLTLSTATQISLSPSQTFPFSLGITGEASDLFIYPSPAMQPPMVTISNSNPSVASAPTSLPASTRGTITALAAGVTSLSFSVPPGVLKSPSLDSPIQVTVKAAVRASLDFADFDLGSYLTASRFVRLSTTNYAATTATISTVQPNLVRLEYFGRSGTEIQVPIENGRDITFFVTGLGTLGETTVTVQVPGVATATARVRIRPTGYVWGTPEFSAVKAATISIPLLGAALDPVTNQPIAMQKFSATLAPTLELSDPRIATHTGFVLTGQAVGETIATLRQPSAFRTPSVLQRARLLVVDPPSEAKRTVRIVVVGGGTVGGTLACNTNPCVQLLRADTLVNLEATPNPGQRFLGWSGQCATMATSCSFRVPSQNDADLVATFGPNIGLSFLPLAPCRIVDTRNPTGPLGGPALLGTRNFPVRSLGTACSIPANAAAYSLNLTVVPRAALGYITIWPGGESRPVVSTLNSLDGRIKANAAIVPASTSDGSINVFSTDLTDLILDINGVFVPPGTTDAQAFYTVPPCRIADTRVTGGTIGALANRAFTIAGCGIPATAMAYALNVTAVPKTALGYLTLWPNNGSARPTVSTLNALTGTVTANLAIVPTGNAGTVNAFVTDASEAIVDVTGYFAPPGQPNALAFRTLAPCRVLDTRSPDNVLHAVSTRDVPVNCGVPSTAKAYSLNATVLPTSILGYLTLFPAGAARPVVSTLNAVDGSLTSNAAIVPAGLNGAISVFVTERTHLILDINGYFAP